jgi:hypothetical protein
MNANVIGLAQREKSLVTGSGHIPILPGAVRVRLAAERLEFRDCGERLSMHHFAQRNYGENLG